MPGGSLSLAALLCATHVIAIAELAVHTKSALVANGEASELEVPFFMYTPEKFSLYSGCDRSTFGNTKHSAALYFIDRLRTSKWRTIHMGDAKLAIVPVLLDWFAHGLCSGNATHHVKNTTSVVEGHVNKLPHVVIAASFASSEILPKLQVALPALRVGTYVAVGSWPASMPHGSDFVTGPCGFHVGFLAYHDTFSHAAPWNKERLAQGLPIPGCEAKSLLQTDPDTANCSEWNWDPHRKLPDDIHAKRQYALEFVGQLDNRTGYSDRWKFMHSRGRMNLSRWYVMSPTNVSLSNLSQCNATRHVGSFCGGAWNDYAETQRIRESSEFSLMLRGDDQASDRLQNAVAALTIPIIIEDDGMEWLPFSHAIKWDEILVVIKRKAFDANASGSVMDAIWTLSEEERAAKRQSMLKARREFLWDYPGSRVHENILQAAVLETADWSPVCDVSAVEYQTALRTGRMDALPMPKRSASPRTMRRDAGRTQAVSKVAAETKRPRAAGKTNDVSPTESAHPSFHPSANPSANPSSHPSSQ
jgi:hypothetical protein